MIHTDPDRNLGANDNGHPITPKRRWDWETAALCLLFGIFNGVFLLIVLPWVAKYGLPGVGL